MARYIDADALMQKLSRMIDHCEKDKKVNGLTALFQVGDAIMDCHTADVAEVRHGRWIINDEDFWTKCSVCEFEYLDEQEDIYNTYRYCPHCGAKMDKGVTE